jgi:hypothetical protein
VRIGDSIGGARDALGWVSLGCGDDVFGRVYEPENNALPATMKLLNLLLFLSLSLSANPVDRWIPSGRVGC